MKQIIHAIFNICQIVEINLLCALSHIATSCCFYITGIRHKHFKTYGLPFIHISRQANVEIGNNFTLSNSIFNAASGIKGRCKIEVRNAATLLIGSNVGISLTTIECHERIVIGNNVKIGFGCHIMDTDFHSLDAQIRTSDKDLVSAKKCPIEICDNVFVGANSMILKGVKVGENAIIGAGSIVSNDIPANVLAAGNPCKVIRALKQ